MSGKRLLIMAPMGWAGASLMRCAARLGLSTAVATCASVRDELSKEARRGVEDFILADFSDPDAVIDAVCGFARSHPIHGVVAGFEFAAALAVKAASRLGLPTNEPGLSDACREKHLMHRAFKSGQVPAAETCECTTLRQCEEAIASLGFPAVMKPAADAGSVNVSVVHTRGGAAEAFRAIRAKQRELCHGMKLGATVVVQEYLRGDEVSVETAVFQGRAEVMAVVDKITTRGPYFIELGHTLPSRLDEAARMEVEETARRAVAALGIVNGVAHVEIKLTPSGPKVVEVGARLPGDKIVDLLEYALGIDEAEAYIRIALGEQPDVAPKTRSFAAIRFRMPEAAGRIRDVQGLHALTDMPGVMEFELYQGAGCRVSAPKSNLDRLGHVITAGNSYDGVDAAANAALSRLQILMEADDEEYSVHQIA